jgi:hypothetical protein
MLRRQGIAQRQGVIDQTQGERLPVHPVTDLAHTEFKGVPTMACCAVRPAIGESIDRGCMGLKAVLMMQSAQHLFDVQPQRNT